MLRAKPTMTHVEDRRSKADPHRKEDSGHVPAPPRRYRRHRHRRPLQPSLPAGHREWRGDRGGAHPHQSFGFRKAILWLEADAHSHRNRHPHSPWISRMLQECGHDVLVANARKVRLIYGEGRKNDKIDAEKLARLARLDPKLLAPVKHRGEASQAHLALLRSRDALVSARTKLVNHIRGAGAFNPDVNL